MDTLDYKGLKSETINNNKSFVVHETIDDARKALTSLKTMASKEIRGIMTKILPRFLQWISPRNCLLAANLGEIRGKIVPRVWEFLLPGENHGDISGRIAAILAAGNFGNFMKIKILEAIAIAGWFRQ